MCMCDLCAVFDGEEMEEDGEAKGDPMTVLGMGYCQNR